MHSLNRFRNSLHWAIVFISIALLRPVDRAWSTDFNPDDVAKCMANYVIGGRFSKSDLSLSDLRYKAGSKILTDRVWEAFRKELADQGVVDATALKTDRWDLLPMKALVKPLIDPQEAAVAEMLAIRRAKHDIWVGTYIFGKDPYAYAKLAEVKAALARGVNVHILLDSEGTPDAHHDAIKALHSLPKGYQIDDLGIKTDKLATVDTVMFDPPSNLAKTLPNFFKHTHNLKGAGAKSLQELFTRRMHTKILGVDMDYADGIAFIGGRNKDGLYYGYEKVGPKTYNDTEIMIRNDISDYKPGQKTLSNTLAREFRKLQGHSLNKWLGELMHGSENKAFKKEVAKMDKASADMWAEGGDYDKILKRMEAEDFLNKDFDQGDFRFLSEIENINREKGWKNPDENGGGNLISITKNLKHLAKYADDEIIVVTPYPNITPNERSALYEIMLEKPDLKFKLVTNSIYSGDNLITQYVVDEKLIPTLKKEAPEAAKNKLRSDAYDKAIAAGRSKEEANAEADAYMKDPANQAAINQFAEQFKKRFEYFALGRLDGTLFGGKEYYGKLHAKYVIFKSKDPSKTKVVVMSYNGDNISRYHNSEIGGMIAGQGFTFRAFQKKTDDLISKSYEWGSDNWKKLRNHPKLRLKRIATKVISKVEKFIDPIE